MAEKLTEGLLQRGYRVSVVANRSELPEHPRLSWIRIPGPDRPFLLMYLWFLVAGGVALMRRRRTIVHAHGAIVPNRADVITVHFCHYGYREVEVPRASRPRLVYRLNAWAAAVISRLAEHWSYRPSRAKKLVAVSDGVAAELRRHFPQTAEVVSVIPNGVDVSAFRPDGAARSSIRRRLGMGEGDLVAVFVGGDWERKGLRFAVEAVGMASEWRLIVVGDGDTASFERFAADAGAAARVHFVGWVDPGPYYAAADAFVFPTRYEAFPLVALEAAAAGLPLLIPPVSGARDLLVDGRNGWLIDRSAAVIAERLRELGSDEALTASMGRQARAAAERYDWERVVDAYDRLYRELARGDSSKNGTP
jgi:glycosyltransferase involved in cell wall biosynthesis